METKAFRIDFLPGDRIPPTQVLSRGLLLLAPFLLPAWLLGCSEEPLSLTPEEGYLLREAALPELEAHFRDLGYHGTSPLWGKLEHDRSDLESLAGQISAICWTSHRPALRGLQRHILQELRALSEL